MSLRRWFAPLALTLLVAACGGNSGTPTPKTYRIGVFHVGLDHVPPSFPAMTEALKSLGFVDGKNLKVDWRNLADEAAAREAAADFLKNKVDVIVAFENQTARAATSATKSIPIVVLHVTNPVEEGFVRSLDKPGGNVTGTVGFRDLPEKQLEMLSRVDLKVKRVLTLVDPTDPVTARLIAKSRDAAAALKLTLVEREATTQADLEKVFAGLRPDTADAVLLVSPNLQTKFQSVTVDLALAHKLAFESVRRDWVDKGALLSYGPDYPKIGREAAEYVAKILRGTRPADLPVKELTQLELAINLKTAATLAVAIPQSVLDLADYVVR